MFELELAILLAVLTALIGPILVTRYKFYLESKKIKEDPLLSSIRSNMLVDEQLEDIKSELKSCRVWVSQFHNGGNFYPTGKSIQKFSIFYEVTKAGVSSVSHTFNNIPTSLYPKAFDHMLNGEQKGIFINDFNHPKVATYGLKGAAESVGTKSSYVIPMFTLDEKFVGSLGLDYVGRKKKLTKNEWEHLQIKAGRIAGYISSYLEK